MKNCNRKEVKLRQKIAIIIFIVLCVVLYGCQCSTNRNNNAYDNSEKDVQKAATEGFYERSTAVIPQQNIETEKEDKVEKCYDDPKNPISKQRYKVGEPNYE